MVWMMLSILSAIASIIAISAAATWILWYDAFVFNHESVQRSQCRCDDNNRSDNTLADSNSFNASTNGLHRPTHRPSTTNRPTNRPTQRAAAIVNYINSITLSGKILVYPPSSNDSASPEEKALQWLIEDDPLQWTCYL